MGRIYSWNLFQEFGMAGGGLTVVQLDPAFTWVVRAIDGVMINPIYLDGDLEFSVADVRFARFVCPPNGVIPIAWRGRYVVANYLIDPGPPPFIPLEVNWAADPTATVDWAISGYRLTPP